ncbi:RibD family protein [uncultured Brevundimonas sp.]|uniref:RibD family protein n=1 Tax=uncultured Brevundimonas sp. TaxID=213418 RepID=UPI002615CA9C|nr:RibD family protein [uncultured Brevundimonas sp.]
MRVTLKLATSLDGRIATASGESRWITGEEARQQVHRLRATHQAVLIGVETAIADDPQLTVRLPGYLGFQPIRVVLDSRQRLPLDSHLVREAHRLPTVIVTTRSAHADLMSAGVTVLTVSEREGRVDPDAALIILEDYLKAAGAEKLKDLSKGGGSATAASDWRPALLVEGGGQVAASFLAAGLIDAIEWFRAPIVLGDEGRPAVGDFVLDRLADAPRFRRLAVEPCGDDLWERYERL